MWRLDAAVRSTFFVAALLMLAAAPSLACCAGVMGAHGQDCCASAGTDPMAETCCEGGETGAQAAGHLLGPAPFLAAPLPAVGLDAGDRARLLEETVCAPRAPERGLFTLHSALLL